MPPVTSKDIVNRMAQQLAFKLPGAAEAMFSDPVRAKEQMDEELMDMKSEFIRNPTGLDENKDKHLASLEKKMKFMYLRDGMEQMMKPKEVPAKSREDVLKLFKQIVDGDLSITKQVTVGSAWSHSQTTISALARASLRNMYASKTHKGSYLLGRIASDLVLEESIRFVLEDPEGNAVVVFLYNYPQFMASESDVKAIFQKGTAWAIREPTYKRLDRDGFADPIVSVDSPSDIVPVYATDEVMRSIRWMAGELPRVPRLLPSVEECRLRGAHEFKEKNWLYAAVCYTDGLRLDKNSLIMRLNRSEAYLRLGWYNSAFYDVNQVINAGIEDVKLLRKAICRAVRASYYSKDYQRAIAYAEKLSVDTDRYEWVKRAKERIREQWSGEYNWCAVYQQTLKECPRPDVADYYGPIEVKELDPLRGRGVYATRDIEIGELLLATKPIASWYRGDDLRGQWDCYLSFIARTGEVSDRAIPNLVAFVAQNMWDDKELATLIGSLYAGPGVYASVPYPKPRIAEGNPLSHPLKSNVDIDMAHLQGVVSFNTFMIDNAVKPEFTAIRRELEKCGYALYGLASFCNHSCLPSAYRAFFGDFLTIRASRGIKKGEEITVQYMPDQNDLIRRKFKSSKMRFHCDCLLCRADAEDGNLLCSLRKETLHEIKVNNQWNLQYAAEMLSRVENSYLDTPARRACGIKPELWNVNQFRAEVAKYLMQKDHRDNKYYLLAIESLMSSMEAQGFKILDKSTLGPVESRFRGRLPVDTSAGPASSVHDCTLLSLEIATIFEWKNDVARAENWVKVAAWIDNIFTGGGSGLFKMRYAQLLQEMQLTDLVERVIR